MSSNAVPSRYSHQLGLAIVLALAGVGCADRSRPIVGVAMGGVNEALLPARQHRFNDSVGTRHRVDLKLAPAGTYDTDNSGLMWASDLVATKGLVGVVGHESSRSALQAAPIYRQRGVVQIVPTGTSGKLATVSPWTFPLVASDSLQGELLARYLMTLKRKRITLFVQDDEYGRGIVASLRKGLEGSETIILEDVTHTPASDFDLLVRSVLSHVPAPDALVLITQGMAAATIAELAWKRDTSLIILGSDATSTSAMALRSLAPVPDHVAVATYWLPDTTNAVTREFVKDYRDAQVSGEPQWYHAALYDAVGLLNAAAATAGNSPSGVREWLRSLGRSRPAYKGVLGDIDFTGAHPISPRIMRPNAQGWELLK